MKIGYSIELVFKIALHLRDKELLENIKNYFGCPANREVGRVGTLTERSGGFSQY